MIKALFAASSCSLLVGLAASLLLPVAVAQETPADFTTQATLTLSGEGPWYRLDVPMALRFAARYADLRDVRVFNSEGQAQAYALTLGRAEQQVQVRQTAVKWFPVRGAKDGSAEAPSIRVQRSDSGTLVEVLSETGGKPEQQILRGWLLDASAIKAPLEQLLDNRLELGQQARVMRGEASLEAGLDQLLDQPVTALQLDVAGVDAGIQVIQSPGGLQRGHAVALRTSPVFTVEFVYHGHHSAFVSGATPYTNHLTPSRWNRSPGGRARTRTKPHRKWSIASSPCAIT